MKTPFTHITLSRCPWYIRTKTFHKQYILDYLDLFLGTNMLRFDFQDSCWSNLCNSKLEKDWFIINLSASFTIGIYWSLKIDY